MGWFGYTRGVWRYCSISMIFSLGVVIFFIISLFFAKKTKRTFVGLGDYTLDDVRSGKIFEEMKDSPSFITNTGSTIPRKKKRKKEKGTSNNKHEERCREIFENIFPGYKFRSCRPDFLKNPISKRRLELDGYNPDIETHLGKGLAFEYDGEQHSRYNPHFHGGDKDKFFYQVAKDDWKDTKCKKEGILLIRIPYYILYADLEHYILDQLRKHKLVN